jgi:hypothetical protein
MTRVLLREAAATSSGPREAMTKAYAADGFVVVIPRNARQCAPVDGT